ncbi:MAG TPA: SusC/RagA family TonB-linked outer membrane protein [Puia sp.]|nr:SusC/RagA family TonB-linked outer membrane protein [Puia sp.]
MKYSFHERAAYCQLRKTLLIMRLTTILLLACILHAGARGTAQTVTLSVNNMPLEQVCKRIEHQTGYYFVYAQDLNKTSRNVSVNVSNASVNDALREVFSGQPFTYQIIDKVIVVNTLNKTEDVQAAKPPERMIRVEGVVLNGNGQPVSEASVTIKTTGKGTFTNEKGEFVLPSVPAGSPLVVTHIGYASHTVTPKEGVYLELKLDLAMSILDAQVVKGYYNTSNRLNTGDAYTVKGDDIARQPVSDPILALVGRVPGLSISQTSGVPGAYSTIQLRGENTIPLNKPTTANDPLYIVDGVPFGSETLTSPYMSGGVLGLPSAVNNAPRQGMSPFISLNPLDIESITVLKDADATAIYGSRGANGVIVITTKKGKVGQNKVDININTGFGKVTRKMHLMHTPEYLEMRREAMKNDGLLSRLIPQNTSIYPDLLLWDTTRYTDWQETLINNNAPFANAQINLSGGSNNMQFLIGGGYNRQGTLFPGNYVDQRVSLHVSISQTSLNQRLHIQLSLNYSNDNSNMSGDNIAKYITLPPNAPTLFDTKGNLNWQPYGGTATWQNPLAYTYSRAKAITNYSGGGVNLSYDLLTGLHIQANLGYSRDQMDQTNIIPSDYYPPPNNFPSNRSSGFANKNLTTWIIEPQISYNRTLGKGRFECLLGSTFQENHSYAFGISGSGYANNSLLTNINAANYKNLLGNTEVLYRHNAIYGRISYDWEQKYIVNITARRDGSSRFGPGKQFGNFGAIGAAWIFSEESFIRNNLHFLSFGKLRASYGVTGNDGIGDYQFLSTYTPLSSSYQGVAGLIPTLIPNPDFRWERVRKLEGAIELGFIQDKILFTLSYYRNRTDNELLSYALPSITGFSSVTANLPALIQNTGMEIALHTKNISTKNLTWISDFTLSVPRNKLVKYPGIENSPYAYTYVVGQPLFIKLIYHYTGVDPATGNYIFATKSGTGLPSYPEDIYPSKSLTQAYYGAINNSITYKGFQLNIMLQIVRQNGLNYLAAFQTPGVSRQNQPEEATNRWQKPGDIAAFQLYRNNSNKPYSIYTSSDGAISDASFARIKNVELSYQLREAYVKKAHLQNVRIYFQCQNLFTFTKYKGLDPETQGLSLPPVRMMTIGAQLTF